MKNKYKWGTNPYYFLAGQHKIHPTFIQSMLNDLKLEPTEMLSAIDNLKEGEGKINVKNVFTKLGNKQEHHIMDGYDTFKPNKN